MPDEKTEGPKLTTLKTPMTTRRWMDNDGVTHEEKVHYQPSLFHSDEATLAEKDGWQLRRMGKKDLRVADALTPSEYDTLHKLLMKLEAAP